MSIPASFWVWIGVLVVVLLISAVLLAVVRRRMLSDPTPDAGSLMEQMRQMHERGELSGEEYDRVRKRMAARAAGLEPDQVTPAKPGTTPEGPKPPISSG